MDAKYRPQVNLFTIASDLKYFLISGYQALPFVIGGTFTVLGLYTAQYAMLFFLLGYLIIAPLLAIVFNFLASIIIPSQWTPKMVPWLLSTNSDICNMLSIPQDSEGGGSSLKTIITPWLAMVAFFLGYMGMNAVSILRKPVEYPPKADEATKKATDQKTMLRRSQTLVGLIVTVLLGVLILIMRVAFTECDTVVGGILSLSFVFLGFAWYYLLSVVGDDRLSDVYGIANRLMTSSALGDAPYACLASA